MAFTLNDLLAKAGVTTPKMSAEEVCEQAGDIVSVISSREGRDVIDLTKSFCVDCLKGSSSGLEILPILSPFGGRAYSVVFMHERDLYYGEYRFRARGICDPAARSMVSWLPCRSFRELRHEVFYKDADVDVSALVTLRAPYDPDGGYVPLCACCTITISTPFQKAIERILNNLCAFARGEASLTWEGPRRVLLETQLEEIGLQDSLDDLISLVRSNNDNWFNVLCRILCLQQEERRYVAHTWLSAARRETNIELPYVAKHTFSLSSSEEARRLSWMHRSSEIGVLYRYPNVSDFAVGLLCVPDLELLKSLFSQILGACDGLRNDKSTWRNLAERMALASLIRQSEEFVAS